MIARRVPAAAQKLLVWPIFAIFGWVLASGVSHLGCAARAPAPAPADGHYADVIAVQATGQPGDYLFSVAISSQDSGCERYADWWEILRPSGELVFRRVMAHSHVNEQPFTRGAGPVAVQPDEPLIVRAHMNVDGYGGVAMRGTASGGFVADPSIRASFATRLADMQPLPDGCEF